MEVLCLMGLHPIEYEKEIEKNSISGMQIAANKLQWGIVKGISDNDSVHVTIYNSMYIGSFPKRYKKIWIPTFTFEHKPGAKDLNIGYCNVTGYKAISRYIGIRREIDEWIRQLDGKQAIIIAYAMTTPFVEILNYIKSKYPSVKCCLVVPDLPEYMNASQLESKLYKIRKQYQCKHFRKMLKPIDGFVLLTEAMTEWFDWDIKHIVVEGISLKTESDLNMKQVEKKKSIVYSGMIEAKYGVVDLVNAFHNIKAPEWTLDLYGNGSALAIVNSIAATDNRIIIHGMVPNSEVLVAQKQSEIVVNPRNDNNTFTKYSFPSKVIEYLGSGTPMVGFMLPGMPDEYKDMFFCVSNEENGLEKRLKQVMDMSPEERRKKGQEALAFIVKEKNAVAQGSKIVSFLQSL